MPFSENDKLSEAYPPISMLPISIPANNIPPGFTQGQAKSIGVLSRTIYFETRKEMASRIMAQEDCDNSHPSLPWEGMFAVRNAARRKQQK
jgi:hypothetical protein